MRHLVTAIILSLSVIAPASADTVTFPPDDLLEANFLYRNPARTLLVVGKGRHWKQAQPHAAVTLLRATYDFSETHVRVADFGRGKEAVPSARVAGLHS